MPRFSFINLSASQDFPVCFHIEYGLYSSFFVISWRWITVFRAALWNGNSLPPIWSMHAFRVHFRPQVCLFFREKKKSISPELKNGPGFLLAPNAALYFLNKGTFLRSPDSAWNSYLFNFSAKPGIGHNLVSFSHGCYYRDEKCVFWLVALSLSWVLRHPDVPLQQRALRLPAHPPEAPSDAAGGRREPHPCADRSNEWVTQEPRDGSYSVATVTIPATSPHSQGRNLTAISLSWLRRRYSFVHFVWNFS